MIKRVIPGILVLALIISTVTAFGADYSDLPAKHWAHEAVSTMSEQGVVKGYNDGSFKPANTVTCGEFIKMAVLAADNEDPGNSKTGNWALSYYSLGVEKGYFTEFDITKNQLTRDISRADMALIISNILGDVKIENYTELENSVSDVDYKTENDYDIIKAYATGIITGYTDGSFKPEGTLNRAESATVIYRLTDESKRIEPKIKTAEEIENGYTLVKTADVIKNLDAIKGTYNCGVFSEYAQFYDSADQFDIKMQMEWSDDWGCGFRHNITEGFVYLMKDGVLVEKTQTESFPNLDGTRYWASMADEIDVHNADYIVVVDSLNSDDPRFFNTKIIPNPLKK